MNLPPRLLNRAVRIGHTVTLPSGTSGIVVDVTDGGFVLDDDSVHQFGRYADFPLITMEQLDDRDRSKIAAIIARRRQEFVATLPARLREYVTQPYTISPGNRHAVEALRSLELGENVMLAGRAGTGKTMLAVQTLHDLAGYYRVGFRSEVELCHELRAKFDAPRLDRGGLTHELIKLDVLVIDDIGKSKHTEFTFQELFAIIDARWLAKRTTIFTANYAVHEAALRVAQAEADADALCSRMASGKVLIMADVDGRIVHHSRHALGAERKRQLSWHP